MANANTRSTQHTWLWARIAIKKNTFQLDIVPQLSPRLSSMRQQEHFTSAVDVVFGHFTAPTNNKFAASVAEWLLLAYVLTHRNAKSQQVLCFLLFSCNSFQAERIYSYYMMTVIAFCYGALLHHRHATHTQHTNNPTNFKSCTLVMAQFFVSLSAMSCWSH